MIWLYLVFLGTALILWVTTFGYLFVLRAFASKRKSPEINSDTLPEIAVVIPALNEESLIRAKLIDLRANKYPPGRMKIFVVDGGSSDKTLAHVKTEIASNGNIELIHLPSARARPDQINHILKHIDHEIVVFTDVDARLEPSCLRELVASLMNDPSAAIIGAFIQPNTPLLEERLHWWFLSHLWWLEGEVLSSANISGVCYACRRKILLPLAWDAYADDINVALSASALGYSVRINRSAKAKEVRVPQTASELVRFRRKRGSAYLTELKRSSRFTKTPLQWKLTRLIRLWLFMVIPKVIPFFLFLVALLVFTQYWLQALLVIGGFLLSVFLAMFIFDTKKNLSCPWWQLPIATFRLVVLTILSVLTLNKAQKAHVYQGE